jgi:hypothetical protein
VVIQALGEVTVTGKAPSGSLTVTGESMVVAVASQVALAALLALHRLNWTLPPGAPAPPETLISAESLTWTTPLVVMEVPRAETDIR